MPGLRNYLVNNSYDKIVDLEERNLRLASFYQVNPKRKEVHTYFEIDENHIDYYQEFLSNPDALDIN